MGEGLLGGKTPGTFGEGLQEHSRLRGAPSPSMLP